MYLKFGIGFSGGTYRTDENCERIKLSKVLNDLGMKVAVINTMPRRRVYPRNDTIRYTLSYNGKIGDATFKEWKKYDKLRPDYEQYTADLKYIERKNKKLEKEYEKKMLENAEELSKQQVELDAVAILEKQKLIDEMNELKGVKKEKTTPQSREKNMEIYIALHYYWIVLIYVPYKLYKIIDSFADDINPYNFSKRK